MLIREAVPDQHAEVMSILNAAALQADAANVRTAIQRGAVLVAQPYPAGQTENTTDRRGEPERSPGEQHALPILGSIVLDDTEVLSIAVRPNRRGQGIGSTLVVEALRSRRRLVAEFDPPVRPFWESLEFDISQIAGTDRLRGTKKKADSPARTRHSR